MRIVPLKKLVTATFYKPLPGTPVGAQLLRVPKGVDYDEATMFQRSFAYRDNIEAIMLVPPGAANPMTGEPPAAKVAEIRKNLKILDALEDVKDGDNFFVLEDIDWTYLDERVQNANWPFVNHAVDEFCLDIHNAKAISKERLDKAAEEDAVAPQSLEAHRNNKHSATTAEVI